ncbi:hypothetical protein [Variovorax guangxiensis]|uniref:hypothetical protein n=1 Tax=Variovorax guangxiensis TaxID=1775474 RepID=UPI00285D2C71|nr:hypothetical protein [Variovorax guangxiensis]MDR6855688.1 hypothetical protein [Variovorax guangxiensis]
MNGSDRARPAKAVAVRSALLLGTRGFGISNAPRAEWAPRHRREVQFSICRSVVANRQTSALEDAADLAVVLAHCIRERYDLDDLLQLPQCSQGL